MEHAVRKAFSLGILYMARLYSLKGEMAFHGTVTANGPFENIGESIIRLKQRNKSCPLSSRIYEQ